MDIEHISDYLIVGGGVAGCVLATRLKQYLPNAKVTLVESGPDEHDHPQLVQPMATPGLAGGPFQYNYKTAPQKHFDGRQAYYAGGKVLSGSSAVNYATWTRGDSTDYDLWAKIVKDQRWSYEGQLPYFKKTEHHHEPSAATASQHGYDGPIYTTPASSRPYPLSSTIKQAYLDVGVEFNEDHNSGNNKGLSVHVEAWRDGKRQPAGKAYGLKDVEVLTNSMVKRIVLQKDERGLKATGAELVSGQVLHGKEVIVCCGAIRSPQLLMLSGIGPAAELQKHGIAQLVDSPDVGQNLHEHCALTQFFRVRNPERGLCALHPAFQHPTYGDGFPCEYEVTESAPTDIVRAALRLDNISDNNIDEHPHLTPPRSHYMLLPLYAPAEVPLLNLSIPLDGSVLSVGVINLLPTSRGTITLASALVTDDPIIDPNYYATETDRAVLRAAVRRNLSALEQTPAGRATVEAEIPPPGYPRLTSSSSTDDEIDARVRRASSVFYHSGGTAAMGRVVDTRCRVIGVGSLRVVDASVLPTPISAAYMVCVYALAEQMADIIVEE